MLPEHPWNRLRGRAGSGPWETVAVALGAGCGGQALVVERLPGLPGRRGPRCHLISHIVSEGLQLVSPDREDYRLTMAGPMLRNVSLEHLCLS